ncbi:MAG: serine/threonine-protein phosphatase [Phycisphaerales bacterium]|nr:serine/threonine-protein phosphatase [Phycisphaerales bacterium]
MTTTIHPDVRPASAPCGHTMQCMEIWGGNQAVDSGISVPGIDAWVFSETYHGEAAGGDIHYVSMCGGGKIARFALADVAGHGSAVADLAVVLRRLMRKHIDTVDQTKFVRALNEEFLALSADGVFATAALTTYFAPTDHLVTCLAGHPAPLWYRARLGTWVRLDAATATDTDRRASTDADRRAWKGAARRPAKRAVRGVSNLPLGVIAPTEYEQFAVPLEKDDLVLIYTDGLAEAHAPDGRMLGEAGLMRIVESLDVADPSAIVPRLLEAVRQFRGSRPIEDDLTVILLRHNAAGPPRKSAGEWAKVVGKMLGLVKV